MRDHHMPHRELSGGVTRFKKPFSHLVSSSRYQTVKISIGSTCLNARSERRAFFSLTPNFTPVALFLVEPRVENRLLHLRSFWLFFDRIGHRFFFAHGDRDVL